MKRNSCLECPVELLFALDKVAKALLVKLPAGLKTPFEDNGQKFSNGTFSVHSYVEGKFIPYNFKWKDIEVSWYIQLGRLTTVNREVTQEEIEILTADCLKSLNTVKLFVA